MSDSAKKITPEIVWELMEKVAKSQEKLTKSQEETDRHLKEVSIETSLQRKETNLQQQEADRRLEETGRYLKEISRKADLRQARLEKRMKELNKLFTGQWGKLIESLVKGDLVRLLNERDIQVTRLSQETSSLWNNQEYEFDIIAVNGGEVVVVEVKTTLKLKHLDHFIEKLGIFRDIFPEYKDKMIYGAIAYLRADEGSHNKAEKKGLFVIRATGNSAIITNKKEFSPKVF